MLVSHSESVNIEFEKPFTLEKVRQALKIMLKVVKLLIKEKMDGGYSTPFEATGKR